MKGSKEVRYYRLCETVKDYGKYIPDNENIFKYVKQNKPYYQSIYTYSEDQVKAAQEIIEVEKNGKIIKRPRGVVGVTDVVTKKLVWDFDSEDINESKKDTQEIVNRLLSKGFAEDNLGIFFSGGKGFHVEIETNKLFTPDEFKAITSSLAEGLKTYDSVVANPSRIFRIPFTKHTSGYYKTRLSLEELSSMTVQEVLEVSKEAYEPEGLEEVTPPSALLSLAVKKEEPKQVVEHDESLFDPTNNPLGLSNWKNALFQGFIPSGQRNNGFMILAATLRGKGFDEDTNYATLKATIRKQAARYGQKPFSKEEFHNNIIAQVYSSSWQGGTFAEDNFPEAIKEHLKELGINRIDSIETDEDLIVDVDQGFDNFFEYATSIDENRLNFGIDSLDRLLKPQKGHLVGLLAGPGIGKCHGKGTKILMFDGSIKNVEDVKVGDLLMGDDSTPRKVLSLARGREELYRVNTDDGFYDVNASHILSLKCSHSKSNARKKGDITNINVRDYLNSSFSFRKYQKGYRVPVKFEEKEVPFSPYLIGSWLGDGTFRKPELTHNDYSLCDHYEKLAKDNGLIYRRRDNPNRATTHIFKTNLGEVNPFFSYIKDTFWERGEKFIPSVYLVNSRENRLELLAGILDTDGYYDKKAACYEVTFKERQLAEDLQFLCRSLGIKATVKEVTKRIKSIDFEGQYYRLYIVGEVLKEVPCLLDRKKYKHVKKQRDELTYPVHSSIESLGEGDYYGFEVDGNHLYCLGDFTVTHNTSLALTLLSNTSKDGVKSFFGSYDMNSSILFQKLLQRETRMTDDEIYDIYRNKDKEKIEEFRGVLAKNYSNVTFCFKVGQTIADLKRSIAKREQVMGEKIGLVVVDYIELIMSDKSDPTAASAEAAQGLREIANSGKVVVVLLQPNKMSSKADEAPKTYNAAKGSSAIAQAVTSMMGCFRPGYNPEDPSMDKYFGIAVLKNRMGPLGTCYFNWHGPTGRITEMEDIERQELQEFLKWKENNSGDGDHGL